MHRRLTTTSTSRQQGSRRSSRFSSRGDPSLPLHTKNEPSSSSLSVGKAIHQVRRQQQQRHGRQRSNSRRQQQQQQHHRHTIGGCLCRCLSNSNPTKLYTTLIILLALAVYSFFMFGALIPVNTHPPHPPLRPIPYPPPSISISVVIMNFARPRMLQESSLLPTLLQHDTVTEVILCHAQPHKTHFDKYDHHPKVRAINATAANRYYGLALRFYYGAQARNDWVLMVDDDMELDDSTINELCDYLRRDPHRIVGHYGRQYRYWKVPHRHGYDFATTTSGPVEVVLTKLLLVERIVLHVFVQTVEPVLHETVVAMAHDHGGVLWNGEDIVLNLVANRYYQVPPQGPYRNYAIGNLTVWEASNTLKDDDSGLHDVSGNMDRHMPHNQHHHHHHTTTTTNKNNSNHVPTSGWLDYWTYWYKSLRHYHARGKLWATAKATLATLDLTTTTTTTAIVPPWEPWEEALV